MDAFLLFSKLAPHLGSLSPNAIQVVLNEPSWQMDAVPPIACCVWISDSHLDILDGWLGLSGCSSSILITTSHTPRSAAHRQLVRRTQEIVERKHRSKSTVILISASAYLSNPNTYINLARLFSKSPWTLLAPPERHPLLPTGDFSNAVLRMELHVQTVDSRMLFDTSDLEGNSYANALLVPRDSPIWCPEQEFFTRAGQEWMECTRHFLLYYEGGLNKTQEPGQTPANDRPVDYPV
ncbi:hypothetical protein FRC08_010715 [Ceratobasidium sp. 394]|nr:hypothetical protein FRC08_010715 [Ceratobasidium sp. 394]